MKLFGRGWVAHRVAFELCSGTAPKAMVLHQCDNRPCCNPSHLFEGTNDDNMKDMVSKGRARTGSRPGAENGNAKLTDFEIAEMRRAHEEVGFYDWELAKAFKIGRSSVGRILRQETHKL